VGVEGGCHATSCRFVERGLVLTAAGDPHLVLLLTAAALVNDASVLPRPDGLHLIGDPTEAALLVAALKAGLEPTALRQAWPRRREMPFDPGRRMMATVHDVPGGGQALFVKGAPGVVLDLARQRQTPLGPVPLTDADRESLLESNRALAADGLRVLAIAWRAAGEASGAGAPAERNGAAAAGGGPGEHGSDPDDAIDLRDLTFLGLVALVDPLKAGVREAIAACRQAGIRTFMLTGDQRATAEAIGRHLGLEAETIRSRVSPEGKLALIEELQQRGDVVAMTGDGVNDAPALARADIGIAMGRQGTDVAREAADLVLSDDNFSTIVKAVEQGRVIYANLRKVIHFLFSCNLSEIITIFAAIVVGFPSPLLPLQILWVNLVTDILPALGLIRDPAEPDVMRRPPRDPREGLVGWRFGGRVVAEGALLAAGTLSAYLWVVWQEGPGPRATTMAFMALVLIHPFQAINCRSDRLGWWDLPPNALSWLALIAIIGLQWMTVSVAPLAQLLGTVPLDGGDWLILAIGILWPVSVMELVKVWSRRRQLGRGRPRAGEVGAATGSRTARNH
jgi:Ca2+-transporting ATPase